MTEPPRRRTTADPLTAGGTILGAMLLLGLVGFGVGALVGATGPLVVAGIVVGLFVGVAGVIRQFGDL